MRQDIYIWSEGDVMRSLMDSLGLPRSEGYIHIKDTEGFLDVTARREHKEDK
jgi:hypothetical protein